MFNKNKKWILAIIFIGLSVAVFYISFTVEQQSFSISLFGLFFVLLIGLLNAIVNAKFERKEPGLWFRTMTGLIFTIGSLYVLLILVFSGSWYYFLGFSITYIILQCTFTMVQLRKSK